jgi:phage terminase large subunit
MSQRLNLAQIKSERLLESDVKDSTSGTTKTVVQDQTIDEVLEPFENYYATKPNTIQDTLYNKHLCPRCSSPLVPTISISGAPSTDWLECSNSVCNTFVDTYHPMPHQAAVHLDSHRIIGNFGSYGTGKTKTSEKEIEKHILITPNANILLGANITSQYEQTLLRDFEKSFPLAFQESRSVQKAYIDFINGARLMLRPFDDPDKLRSNNYSLVVMLEASEIDADAYHQLKTRLRNMAAATKDRRYSWRKLICESNPDSGWIRTDVLLVSDKIFKHGRFADEDYASQQDPLAIDPAISTHIASTDVNHYLPADYIQVNSRNKPDWWIKRFIHGSFLFAEGLVYPSAAKCVVPTPKDSEGKPLGPKHFPDWKILIAHDYGLMDEATFVYAAVDTKRNKLVVYKVEHTNNAPLKDLVALFKEGSKDIAFGQLYTTPIIDPKNNKRDYNKKDLISHYQDYGISFKPGYTNVDARIIRLNDYIESGCLEIWDCCTFLINELKEYKFKPKSLDDKTSDNKPIDANNHAINALEWIAMELPANPNRLFLTGYDEYGRPISAEEEKAEAKRNQVWQLSDDSDENPLQYDQTTAFGIEGGVF